MYCEDADLCLRMVLLGYRGLYVPEARAYHAWAATTGRGSAASRFYSVRNTLTTLLKDMPLVLARQSAEDRALPEPPPGVARRCRRSGSVIRRLALIPEAGAVDPEEATPVMSRRAISSVGVRVRS